MLSKHSKKKEYTKHVSLSNDNLKSIEIEEENKLVKVDDVFDESQSGILPFWLKNT